MTWRGFTHALRRFWRRITPDVASRECCEPTTAKAGAKLLRFGGRQPSARKLARLHRRRALARAEELRLAAALQVLPPSRQAELLVALRAASDVRLDLDDKLARSLTLPAGLHKKS